MNIVYLLVHKVRLEENNPPYFYIGSKKNWKGEGSYKSSSRHDIVLNGYSDDLLITPLWVSEDCSHIELLEKEKEFQLKHDVLKNPKFFNRNIANSLMFAEDIDRKANARKAKITYKRNAVKLNEQGIPYGKVWSDATRATILKRYTKEERSKWAKDAQYKVHESGYLVKEVVHRKMMESMSAVDESGLTGFQRAGEKLSEVLNTVVIEGTDITKGKLRQYFGYESTRFTMFNFCFFSTKHATELIGIDIGTLARVRSGKCSEVTYQKLCNVFGKDSVDSENIKIKNQWTKDPLYICGHCFGTYENLKEELGVTYWAVEQLAKTGRPNKKLKKALIEMFGEDRFYSHYPEQ